LNGDQRFAAISPESNALVAHVAVEYPQAASYFSDACIFWACCK
jgi:hypothetical protein